MADEATAAGGYSWVNPDEMARQKTDRPPPPGQEKLVAHLLAKMAEMQAASEAQAAQLATLSSELSDLRSRTSAPPPRGVSREEASKIGSQFWAIIDQQKGPKEMHMVEVRPGFKDAEGDGNVAYRVFRVDGTKQGTELYRLPEELFHSEDDAKRAAFPRKMSGRIPKT